MPRSNPDWHLWYKSGAPPVSAVLEEMYEIAVMNKTSNVESCFVVMPFGDVWDEYYRQVYAPAIQEAALRPERSDDVFRAGSILQDIVGSLSRATVVLVDITENNRNVHYELGLAHALGRPTLLIAPRDQQLFFDVGQERMLTYDKNNAFWGDKLKDDLVRALRETRDQPQTAIPTAFMHIKPTRIESDEVVLRLRRIEEQLAELVRVAAAGRVTLVSGLVEKMKSLPAAQDEAEKLLRTMSRDAAIRQLMNQGYGAAMAETAVDRAAGSK